MDKSKDELIQEVAQKLAISQGINPNGTQQILQYTLEAYGGSAEAESLVVAIEEFAMQQRKKLPWWRQIWLRLTEFGNLH